MAVRDCYYEANKRFLGYNLYCNNLAEGGEELAQNDKYIFWPRFVFCPRGPTP
jgi:hypothetical protein